MSVVSVRTQVITNAIKSGRFDPDLYTILESIKDRKYHILAQLGLEVRSRLKELRLKKFGGEIIYLSNPLAENKLSDINKKYQRSSLWDRKSVIFERQLSAFKLEVLHPCTKAFTAYLKKVQSSKYPNSLMTFVADELRKDEDCDYISYAELSVFDIVGFEDLRNIYQAISRIK